MTARATTAGLFVAVIGGAWDTWWHVAIGRESFWSPPHLLLYAGLVGAIGLAWYGWRATRAPAWRRVAVLLSLVPLSAPFDELWHRSFGVEALTSPLVLWSPPHLLLIGAVLGAFVLLLPLLGADRDAHATRFFAGLAFAAILWLTLLLVDPLQPLGWWNLLGFAGAGVVAVSIVGILMSAARWLPGLGGATETAIFYLVLFAVGWSEHESPGVVTPPHPDPPAWLWVFALLAAAVVLDLRRPQAEAIRGGLAGLAYGAIVYLAAGTVIPPEWSPGARDVAIAIVASGLGGAAAGVLARARPAPVAALDKAVSGRPTRPRQT